MEHAGPVAPRKASEQMSELRITLTEHQLFQLNEGSEPQDVPRLSDAQMRALGNLCRGTAYLINGRLRFRGCSESFSPATASAKPTLGLDHPMWADQSAAPITSDRQKRRR